MSRVPATVAKPQHFCGIAAWLSIAVMNLYPRSFVRLMLVAWVVMALPLFVAIAYSSVSATRLAARSQESMQQAAEATRLAWELDEDLRQMERILRQYEVLRDPSQIDDYVAMRREWLHNSAAFAEVPMLATLADRVRAMAASETAAYRAFEKDPQGLGELQRVVSEHYAQATEIIVAVRGITESVRQSFGAETEALQQRLLIAVALALGVAGVLLWLGQRILGQLLKGVERAVIALGNNLLERRIKLRGPDDLRWIGRRLDWLRKRMLTLEEERTRTLRHISHELKTPLAALREGSSLLSEGVAGPLTPRQEKIAGIMQGNALRLQELIDGLLKLQQAEHSHDLIEPLAIRLDDLIQDALETQKLAARDKRLRITGTLAPLTVMGGREETLTIVNNLLSNAIKFSPPRGTIRLSLTRDNKSAILDVTDEGPGVPETDRNNIFEPFYRGPETRSVAGYGLGLAIAREFAVAQRGSLELLPEENGAHFRASLPLAGVAK